MFAKKLKPLFTIFRRVDAPDFKGLKHRRHDFKHGRRILHEQNAKFFEIKSHCDC